MTSLRGFYSEPGTLLSHFIPAAGAGKLGGNAEPGNGPHEGLSAASLVRRARASLVQPVLGPAAGGTLTSSTAPHGPVPSDLLGSLA